MPSPVVFAAAPIQANTASSSPLAAASTHIALGGPSDLSLNPPFRDPAFPKGKGL
jgi:hypothetical protein